MVNARVHFQHTVLVTCHTGVNTNVIVATEFAIDSTIDSRGKKLKCSKCDFWISGLFTFVRVDRSGTMCYSEFIKLKILEIAFKFNVNFPHFPT